MSPRFFAMLCILQTAALTGGYLMMRHYAQIWDRLPLNRIAEGSTWTGWMQCAKWATWPLLLLPAFLMAAGTKRVQTKSGAPTVRPRWFWLCAAVTIGILCYSAAIVVVARNGPPRRAQPLNH